MSLENIKPHWAAKVPRAKIRRLYETDAQGIIDSELIDQVGWSLWERCDSILTVTAAHNGQVRCPACNTLIERENPWAENELLTCPACSWQMHWKEYHQTYRGKQLFGANAVEIFQVYHTDFPKAQSANQKMLLIDQLIHAFHLTLTEIGRPAAANLIEGSLGDVIHFLTELASSESSAAGLGDSRSAWRRTLASAPWTQVFIKPEPDSPQDTP